MKAFEDQLELADFLCLDPVVATHMRPDEIRALLDPHEYIGTAVEQVERLEGKLRAYLL
jgi:adenylosuccinate lyase